MSPTTRPPTPDRSSPSSTAGGGRCAARPAPAPKAMRCARPCRRAGLDRPPCARPAGSLPPRRHQAALCRLGRADGLLPLFGGAGRPLRARPAWRVPALWPLNDALCAALQVINHLQDCAKDYRELDRVYIPLDALRAAGPGRARRSASRQASPALRAVIAGLAPTHRRAARSIAAVRRSHRRPAAGAGSRRHPGAGREPRASPERRDPLSRARPPSCQSRPPALALRGGLGVACRRLGRMFGSRQPGLHGSRDDRRPVRCRRVPGAQFPAARSTPPCA